MTSPVVIAGQHPTENNKVCLETVLRTSLVGRTRYEGDIAPQESLPAPLTGKSERLNYNKLRNADS